MALLHNRLTGRPAIAANKDLEDASRAVRDDIKSYLDKRLASLPKAPGHPVPSMTDVRQEVDASVANASTLLTDELVNLRAEVKALESKLEHATQSQGEEVKYHAGEVKAKALWLEQSFDGRVVSMQKSFDDNLARVHEATAKEIHNASEAVKRLEKQFWDAVAHVRETMDKRLTEQKNAYEKRMLLVEQSYEGSLVKAKALVRKEFADAYEKHAATLESHIKSQVDDLEAALVKQLNEQEEKGYEMMLNNCDKHLVHLQEVIKAMPVPQVTFSPTVNVPMDAIKTIVQLEKSIVNMTLPEMAPVTHVHVPSPVTKRLVKHIEFDEYNRPARITEEEQEVKQLEAKEPEKEVKE